MKGDLGLHRTTPKQGEVLTGDHSSQRRARLMLRQ